MQQQPAPCSPTQQQQQQHLAGTTEEVDESAVHCAYVFITQGLWREQLHYEVITKYQEQQCQGSMDTSAMEDAIEQERATKWVLAAKDKRKSKQRETVQYMLSKGAPNRGILAFLWRHPECQSHGVLTTAIARLGFSQTFARVMASGWLDAFERYEADSDMSDEEEHEGILAA